MGPEVVNKNRNCVFNGPYAGRDLYITMYQDNEREFVVTHNANIKPVSYFTGRGTELQDLRQRIEGGRKSVLVSGMGGIGKTHICRKLFEEYVNKHAADENGPFRHIGYVEYSGDMSSSLQNCLKFKQQEKPDQNQEAAWRELEYLASNGKLLLFVDNVDKAIREDAGLQRLKGIPGAVVLTSRQASFGDEFEPYHIGFLGMEQCKEIYEKIRFRGTGKKVDQEEVEDLEYIIESLAGRHTITVELLAHLARTKLWTVKRLREELEEKGFRLTFHKGGELVNIQESYEKLYDLSELTEAEQNILEAFSVFPYIPLAAETCNEWLLADAGVSEDDDILMGLYQKGWLQFDADQEGYALHPVFAQFICEKYKPTMEEHSELVKACQKCLQITENRDIQECYKFIPFGEKIIKKMVMIKGIEQINFMTSLAYLLETVAKYKQAEKLYERIIGICELVFGENHANTATGYDNLAGLYMRYGDYEKTEELYKKSLQIRKNVFGEFHLTISDSYHNLAEVYAKARKFKQAFEMAEKSKQSSRRVIAMALGQKKCEKVDNVEELYIKKLHKLKSELGEEVPEVANSYIDLAGLYAGGGLYIKAEEACIKALQIQEKVLGENGLEVVKTCFKLISIYEYKNKYEKAEEVCIKALQIQEKTLGENNLDVAKTYCALANIYEHQNEYEKAKRAYEKTLQIQEKMYGRDNLDVAKICCKLADIYEHQNEYEKAKKLNEKALLIRKGILGENHPDIAYCYNNLGIVYLGQGKYEKAVEMFKINVQILEKISGQNHMNTAIGYRNLAKAYGYKREYKIAEELYEKSIRIKENLSGQYYLEIVEDCRELLEIHKKQGLQEIHKKSLKIMEKLYCNIKIGLGENHPEVISSFKALEEFRKAAHEYDEFMSKW